MAKSIALLDVDHTLIFQDNSLNQVLIDSLIKNGIKDVYLFTDMTFKHTSVEERIALITKLEAQGLTVHGVITPCDLLWDKLTAKDAEEMVAWQKNSYKGKLYGEDFEGEINKVETKTALPFLEKVMSYAPEDSSPGIAFKDAQQVYNNLPKDFIEGAELPGKLNQRSAYGKVFFDQLAKDYPHSKGLLLDFFLHHTPPDVDGILVFDDNDKVIDAVRQYKTENNPAVPITKVHVTPDSNADSYDDAMQKHRVKINRRDQVQQLQTLCQDYKDHLQDAVVSYVKGLPRDVREALTTENNEVDFTNILNNFSAGRSIHWADHDLAVKYNKYNAIESRRLNPGLYLAVEKLRLVNHLLDDDLNKKDATVKQRLANFKTRLTTPKNQTLLNDRRDSNIGAKFLESAFHILTLGIYSKLTKGTFKFWKSHGEVFSDKASEAPKPRLK